MFRKETSIRIMDLVNKLIILPRGALTCLMIPASTLGLFGALPAGSRTRLGKTEPQFKSQYFSILFFNYPTA